MSIFAKIEETPKQEEPKSKFVKIEGKNEMSLEEISEKLQDSNPGYWLEDVRDDEKKALLKYTLKVSKYSGYLSEEVQEQVLENRDNEEAVMETLGLMLIEMVRVAQCYDKDLMDIVKNSLSEV